MPFKLFPAMNTTPKEKSFTKASPAGDIKLDAISFLKSKSGKGLLEKARNSTVYKTINSRQKK